jgi:hypothetical protein
MLIERQITVKVGLKLSCPVDSTGPLGGLSLSPVVCFHVILLLRDQSDELKHHATGGLRLAAGCGGL